MFIKTLLKSNCAVRGRASKHIRLWVSIVKFSLYRRVYCALDAYYRFCDKVWD
jgi:hypothetical protein